MGIVLIIIGILILKIWSDIMYNPNPGWEHRRIIDDHPFGCIPYLVGIAIVIIGIYIVSR
jgi:hypothetical protein